MPVDNFNRSSRVLSGTAPTATPVLVDEINAHPHQPHNNEENEDLINNELTIHQKTAELASIDFSDANSLGNQSINNDMEDSFIFESNISPQSNINSDHLKSNPDLESFNTLLGNTNNNNNGDEYFEFNNIPKPSSKTSSLINFTKKINRSVSSKLMNINNNSSTIPNSNLPIDGYGSASRSSVFEPLIELGQESLHLLPSVFLGLLLNVLDALSYGMIIFPINQPLFSDLGPTGLSMFYVSCIISQLVYSLGGSAFKSAIGSEMIEVTPFFHSMAINIMNSIGTDDSFKNKEAIVATTIVCYCISCLMTGLVFFCLGKFKLGQAISFFPRHILIGSIGGVGYFLVVTGIEVTSRLSTSFAYNWETLQYLFTGINFIKWFSSLFITIILVLIQAFSKKLSGQSLLLPVYFMIVFAFIHLIIWINPNWDLQKARDNGFIFDVQAVITSSNMISTTETHEAWYHFWSLYKFSKVHWRLIFQQSPTMLALTFFGMLHVPINVPALAISTGNDDKLDLDRELLAHGYSNFLSGLCGSIQNYLVYSNSLLFIKSGAGDKRLAGILLAISTAIVMFIGPILIKFIPVCVVGSLIFLLGYELMKESLYDSYEKLPTFDYLTIIVIIVTMGLVDFVYGIILGILIAFISFIVENAKQNPIKKEFTGENVRSTIKRNNLTNTFLRNVGSQTLVVKLQGNIFFGSIGKIEKDIKMKFLENNESNFRYLILDLNSVLTVDYTAAEGLQNIRTFATKNNCFLIVSSIKTDAIFKSLFTVGIIDQHSDSNPQLFHDLNSALEWCENEYLITIYNMKQNKNNKSRSNSIINYGSINNNNNNNNNISQSPSSPRIPRGIKMNKPTQDEYKYNLTESYLNPMSLMNNPNVFGSPRQRNLINAITKSVNEYDSSNENVSLLNPSTLATPQISNPNPLPTSTSSKPRNSSLNAQESSLITLLQKTFQGILPPKPDSFWKPLLPFLEPVSLNSSTIYDPDDAGYFCIVESGLIQLKYDFNNQEKVYETLLPKTAFASLGSKFKKSNFKQVNITALKDSKIYKLSNNNFLKLLENNKDLANELLLIEINLLNERFDKITNYILISS